MTAQPACADCASGALAFPCRRDGAFDPSALAAGYLANVIRDASETGEGGAHWSFGCLDGLCREAPDAAWATIRTLLPRLETAGEAVALAAGALEDLIAASGPLVIDRIETLAEDSPRFRFVLSGVWPQRRAETDVWKRLVAARAPGPSIDGGAALPRDQQDAGPG